MSNESYIDRAEVVRDVRSRLTWTQSQVAIGATSTELAAAAATAKAYRIQNISNAAIDVSIDGTAATTDDGARLQPNDWLFLDDIDRDDTTKALYAIDSTGAGGKNVRLFVGV